MTANSEVPQRVRWGIIGPGQIARKFASDISLVEGTEIGMVVSRDVGRARKFADEFGIPKASDDENELAADPRVDLVYIASPHQAHFPMTKRMLLAGKGVLCEKPLTLNHAEASELVGIAREKGVFLMEALWSRFLPVYDQVREWLEEGRIGTPRFVSSCFCVALPDDPSARWLNPELAGGSLLDLGVYNLAITQLVMKDRPEEVAAVARFAGTGVDEMISASLRYGHGGLAQFTCGISGAYENSLMIGGDKGMIRVPTRFIDAEEATLTVDETDLVVKAPRGGQGYEFEIAEAVRCFRGGRLESPLMSHADTLVTMETMDRIRCQIGLAYPGETPAAEK